MLEGSLKLRLNMDKTKITHVNDGFIFLGHRIIRKRSRYGEMRVVSTIPQEKARKNVIFHHFPFQRVKADIAANPFKRPGGAFIRITQTFRTVQTFRLSAYRLDFAGG